MPKDGGLFGRQAMDLYESDDPYAIDVRTVDVSWGQLVDPDSGEYTQTQEGAGIYSASPTPSLEAQLVDAILAVARGEYYAPARLLAELAREMAHGDPYKHVKLTPREREVVRRIAQGSTYREIAQSLGISEKTVATYRERASEKLGFRSRAELVRWALENGVLD